MAKSFEYSFPPSPEVVLYEIEEDLTNKNWKAVASDQFLTTEHADNSRGVSLAFEIWRIATDTEKEAREIKKTIKKLDLIWQMPSYEPAIRTVNT